MAAAGEGFVKARMYTITEGKMTFTGETREEAEAMLEPPTTYIGAHAQRVFVGLHHGLQAIGRCVGQLTLLALAIGLFITPIVAMLMASLYAALGVSELLGGGTFLIFVLFWIFVGLTGWYVSPHVQPRITEAFQALLKSN